MDKHFFSNSDGSNTQVAAGESCTFSEETMGRINADINTLNQGLLRIRTAHSTAHGSGVTIFGEAIVSPGHNEKVQPDDIVVAQHLSVCSELVSILTIEKDEINKHACSLHAPVRHVSP